jgi:hypothetical protein
MKLYVGQRIVFRRQNPFGDTMHGYVISLTGDPFKPAKVRNNGRVYIPHIDDYVKDRA